MSRESIPILSFFTGGGFLDIGFERAGFQVVWANEYHHAFADMYEFAMDALRRSNGHPKVEAVKPNRKSIIGLKSEEILDEAFGGRSRRWFGIIGGPPCPDFSMGGKHNGITGKNGRLTHHFVARILELKPSFFLIENVAGLVRVHRHRKDLDKIVSRLVRGGYAVDWTMLNALEFGVPQDRERVFIFGIRNGLLRRHGFGIPKAEALGWFPWPNTKSAQEIKKLCWPKSNSFGSTPRRPRDLPRELMVMSCLGRQNNPVKVPNGTDYFKPYSLKFSSIDEGDESGKSFKRLHRYRYSPTAWFGNNEVHLHPWEPRRLSVREALRIQSVPDEYVLPPEATLTAKFKLIGNGVPCKLAEGVANAIHGYLQDVQSGKESSAGIGDRT